MAGRIRTGIRAAPKVQEKELIRKAETLRTHPEALVPRCLEEFCPRCPFDGLRDRLRRIAQAAEDEAALERYARRGPPLPRAYAATLLLAIQGKAPYLAPAKTPFGTVHYASRGKATREHLVGVQYFDVPELRVLTVGDLARKRRLHVYSLEAEMVTTCREDRPPETFVQESLARSGIAFRAVGEEYRCPHAEDDPALLVRWHGAEVTLAVCRRCHAPKGNLATFLGSRMIVPRLADAFSLALRLNLACRTDRCSLGEERPVTASRAIDYFAGTLDEATLLEREVGESLAQGARTEGLFVLGNQCFEDDYPAFLDALKVEETLRPALLAIQDDLAEGLVLPEPSVAKLLEALDREARVDLLEALLEDEEMAEGMVEAAEAEGRSMDAVVDEALATREEFSVVARLPHWETLPPMASFADGVARTYQLKGEEEAAVLARRGLEGEARRKVVALAFLQALDAAAGKVWMFREEEKQLADFLTPTAETLLTAEGAAYAGALQQLLTASGSGETLPAQ